MSYSPARRGRYRQLLLYTVSPTALVMATPSQQREDALMYRWICGLLDFWRREETRFPEFPGLQRSILRSERAIQSAMTRAGVEVGDHLAVEQRGDLTVAAIECAVADMKVGDAVDAAIEEPKWRATVTPEETYRV